MASLAPFWESAVEIAVAFFLVFLFIQFVIPGCKDEWR